MPIPCDCKLEAVTPRQQGDYAVIKKARVVFKLSVRRPSHRMILSRQNIVTPQSAHVAVHGCRLQVWSPYPIQRSKLPPTFAFRGNAQNRMSTLVLLRQVRSPGQITFQWFGCRRHSFPSSTNVRLCSLQHWLLLSFRVKGEVARNVRHWSCEAQPTAMPSSYFRPCLKFGCGYQRQKAMKARLTDTCNEMHTPYSLESF